jgi:two-component system cell cycle sensor histidine kinase/response regulator CckA
MTANHHRTPGPGPRDDPATTADAQEALRDSERRFRALADATSEVVWVTDAAGDLIGPQPSFERFAGRSTAELAAGWILLVHPEDRAELLAQWGVARRDRQVFDVEYRMQRADGAWRRMHARAAPVMGDDGSVRGWVGVNADVTEQRETEERLRASEARLARAQEIGGIGTWELDARTRRTIVSPNVWRMHGLAHEAPITHDDWLASLPSQNRAEVDAGIEAAFRDGTSYHHITHFTRADGSVFIAEARAERVVDADGTVRLLGTLQDVTERVASEAALRESEERLALIFNSAFDSMFLVSVDGDDQFRLRLVNAAFTRITGVPAEQVIGKELREISAEHAAVQVARYREAVRTRQVVEFEESYELNDRLQVMETRLIPVTDPSGTVTHMLGTSRDISERRRIEAERQAMDVQLQHAQKLESLGVLAGGVAHDFNNLLVGILGNASLALLDATPGSEIAEALADIEKTARQAAELTNQLLAYSGKGRFNVTAVDLTELVSQMTPVWRSALSKRAHVSLALADALPPVEGDAAQLRQVVLNMMTNASDALDNGAGTIVVRTGVWYVDERMLRDARFSAGAQPGEHVYVEVEDSGCGMDPPTIERMFDPFFTTKFTGRGLGLAATLGIVRGHRGVIFVRSAPGAGTTFRVSLPARRELRAARPATAAVALAPGAGTVLVIDDEASVRIAIGRILARAGYRTLEAPDGAAGLALFQAHAAEIDCVVVDLTMPGLGGVEVASAIRAMRGDVHVVLSSGYDAGSVTELAGGAFVFLHKPFSAAQLVEAVQPRHGS